MSMGRSGMTRYTLGLPVVLIAVLALTTEDFREPQNLLNFSGQIAALLLASLGQLFVTLVAGIDLSVGSVVSMAACIVATNSDPTLAVALALCMGIAVGVVNGLGVAVAGVHPLVMTLSTATVLQGLAYVVLPIPGGNISPSLTWAATSVVGGVPLALLWCVAAAVLASWIINYTRIGSQLFAVGSNPRSSYLNGVKVRSVVVFAYVACSVAAAIAGVYVAARISAGDPTLGAAFGLESVAAVALGGVQLTGGIGSVSGVISGALSLGLLTNGLNLFGISPFMREVLTGCLLLAAVSVQRRSNVGL